MKKLLHYSLGLVLLTSMSFAQQVARKITVTAKEKQLFVKRSIPSSSNVFDFNMNVLKSQLKNAPMRGEFYGKSNTIIEIPNSNGKMIAYRVEEAPVFAPGLQDKYPEIRAYSGSAVNDASSYLRFTISPYNGVNGIVLTGNRSESIVLQSISSSNVSKTAIFKRSDRKVAKPFKCTTKDDALSVSVGKTDYSNKAADDGKLRTFDLAMSVTGEYSAYHGGTLASVNAAIATTVARLNSVYEIDFAMTFVLIASNDNVVFLDAATDPYGDIEDDYSTDLQATLDQAPPTGVGSAAYDIGHLMSSIGNSGSAGYIGCICTAGQKGSGYTTSVNPVGDNFDIDFVAHEVGHQSGGNHTFTHSPEGAGIAQMEPGSGSTIMGYAGITGGTDVQKHSDPYFHAASIQQITAHAKSRTCDVETATGNAIPVVNAGLDMTLPIGTAFKLTGSAIDANGADVLTYCWEQYNENDGDGAYPDPTSTNNDRPLFRSYSPTAATERAFPAMISLAANGVNGATFEKVPTVGRTGKFRLTVRDNRVGGAGNSFDDMVVTWDASKGPLAVTSQAVAGVVWNNGNTETITWDVNSTSTMAGAANVDILLSLDGGVTYPTTLASAVANNGTYNITVPNSPAPFCRVMVAPTGAPFFAINTIDFSIDYTVTTTCEKFADSPNIPIPAPDFDDTFTNAVITSTSTKTFGSDVYLKVGVKTNHTFINDLDFDILSPSGSQLILFSDLCGVSGSGLDVTFYDGAGVIVCANPTVGNVSPINAFSGLNGETATGTWTLKVRDLIAGDSGDLQFWSVEICDKIGTPLSVKDNDFANFSVYPNPSNGNVNITLSSKEDVQISLFDIRGRQVYGKLHDNNSVTFNKTVDFSAVAAGVYLLNVESGAKKATKKLVIQ